MRSILMLLASVLVTIIIIPMVLIQSCDVSTPEIEKEQIVENSQMVRVYMHKTQKIVEMDLEEYIKGVISGEMPASFEMEALKAQAVAARSYAVSRILKFKDGGQPAHPGAELCDDVHCQVWLSKDQLREVKPKYWMRDYWPKIEEAVEETQGLILTYQGEPIGEPLFHSSSGGRTENSEDVFASAVPYLRSVESPYEENTPHYAEVQVISIPTFIAKFKSKYNDSDINASNLKTAIKIMERSTGGRILKMQVGNKAVTGREIRELLGLRSANFKMTIDNKNIEITTFGNGHGVGMSQYGANGMALNGYNFEEILKHYYVGTEVMKMK
ncbi:stage II sporulation protein D [Anaerosolibacter carboniphilus]|uniref:Stage II sporulation protein D n=1 Tax=Anaerosolibacter carboniphilus TaxID=1417629 RepID=A0A841L1W9_9FIRM|nr:stage II sporulation protein D [Anaerosolibacter carboniphilus]MBB6216355.1 stage II sporulation protein D [Anaerosolibacter carboniphilus]